MIGEVVVIGWAGLIVVLLLLLLVWAVLTR